MPGRGAARASRARRWSARSQWSRRRWSFTPVTSTTRWNACARLGGREFAAIAGAIIAARYERIPVILDGFPATAAAAVLYRMDASALDHCLLGHMSAEEGHRRLARELGKTPVLSLSMRLGEGTGAALAASIVKAAVATHSGMATFDAAGVSNRA